MTDLRQRQPRVLDPGYLKFLHCLPSCVSGMAGDIHAAHVRFGSIAFGKRPTGAGEKPDDRWAVPLLAGEHLFGADAQHSHGEEGWWMKQGVNPLIVAALLYSHYKAGNTHGAETVCRYAKEIAPWTSR